MNGGGNLPYSDGSWGEKAKERSKRRLEYFREYYRKHPRNLSIYYQKHREELLEKNRKYRREHKEQINKRYRARYQNIREKKLAEAMAYYHVPLDTCCSLCGATQNLLRHHPNYNEPLKIITVCRVCHKEIHRKEVVN